jgi:hypothetical protein
MVANSENGNRNKNEDEKNGQNIEGALTPCLVDGVGALEQDDGASEGADQFAVGKSRLDLSKVSAEFFVERRS